MELILATGNNHKAEELQEIMKDHRIIIPRDLGIDFDFEETGTTFFENSYGKAMHLFKQTGKPVIADDSGLCVPALDGAPGIYSARYGAAPGEPDLESPERNALLLSQMEGIENREAFFVCSMVLIMGEYRFFAAQETVEGEIIRESRGVGGFGYDPLFYLPHLNKTIAELPAEEKNLLSHRGLAGKKMAAIIDTINI
ncbi:MAG: RdgB/HAM1 family non-canonical purine NTP pyrophosphatase [Spirochaetales bacterium]|nr:RdgB/HAM1 family non-canonical purine NTP pyrophosphatase [Spirochaetales bacterium]